jgi:hypothetical protein
MMQWPGRGMQALSNLQFSVAVGTSKVAITSSHTGWKCSIKLNELAELITSHYLARIFPLATVQKMIEGYLDIKFQTKAVFKKNYIKPKREGLRGLAMDIADNVVLGAQEGLVGTLGSKGANLKPKGFRLSRTVEALTDALPQLDPDGPTRNFVLKIVADLAVTPKTWLVPLRGKLKVVYEAAYLEFDDRLEVHLLDLKVVGGLQYHIDLTQTIPLPPSEVRIDPFGSAPFGLPHERSGTMPMGLESASSAAPLIEKRARAPLELPLTGVAKIKQLTYKHELEAAVIKVDRGGTVSFMTPVSSELLMLVMAFFILFFINTERFSLGD